MSLDQSSLDEQSTLLLVEECFELYKSRMEDKFSSATETDEFYQLHANTMFQTLSTFSDNFGISSIDVKYLSDLNQKLRTTYVKYQMRFNTKRGKFEQSCKRRLEESFDIYNAKMTEKSKRASIEELRQAHEEASNEALKHFETNTPPNTHLAQQTKEDLKKWIRIQEEVYKIKNAIGVDLNDDWFTKLLEALKKYDKEMSDKCNSGISNDDELNEAYESASKSAINLIKSSETKNQLQLNYATTLLERSMESLKEAYRRQFNLKIGVSIPASEIFIQNEDGFLGKGGYGGVYLGFIKYLDAVAIKRQLLHGSKITMEKSRDKFIKEVKLLNEANHPNIVRIEGYTSWRSSMAIVMEYLPGGDLHDVLVSKDGDLLKYNISTNLKLRFCADISSGITYLHNGFNDKRMVHGDLKPANILLTSDLRCKVADFGGAEFATCTEEASSRLDDIGGGERTRGFAAPERVSKPFSVLKKSMDVYSYGVIVYCILERSMPHIEFELFRNTVLKSHEKHSKDSSVNDLLASFMKECCEEKPENRPDMLRVRDNLLKCLSSIDVADIAEEVVGVLKKMSIKVRILQEKDCTPLADLGDNLRERF